MMERMSPAVIAASLILAGTFAHAGNMQSFDVDCDVPEGHVTEWKGTFVGFRSISGSIELLEPRTHERWLPSASVLLLRGKYQMGLQLVFERKSPESLQVSVVRLESLGGRAVLTTIPWKANPVAFSMSLTSSGDVDLTVANRTVSLGVKNFSPERVSVSCSTADFKFRDIIVQTSDVP